MKIFKFFLLVFLFGIGIESAQAQFTLLPGTDKNYQECYEIINDYIRFGNKFSEKVSEEIPDFKNAEENYDTALLAQRNADEAAQAALENLNLCIEQNGSSSSVCSSFQTRYEDAQAALRRANAQLETSSKTLDQSVPNMGPEKNEVLACGIKTGRITLAMVPHYITYIANFILGLIGLIAVLFTVIGGYYYVFGGLGEDKDKGKNTIKHAIMGMGLATLAWAIVNVIIQAITG